MSTENISTFTRQVQETWYVPFTKKVTRNTTYRHTRQQYTEYNTWTFKPEKAWEAEETTDDLNV